MDTTAPPGDSIDQTQPVPDDVIPNETQNIADLSIIAGFQSQRPLSQTLSTPREGKKKKKRKSRKSGIGFG